MGSVSQHIEGVLRFDPIGAAPLDEGQRHTNCTCLSTNNVGAGPTHNGPPLIMKGV
jgi:hypothetical protein